MRVSTVDEAVRLLDKHGEAARPLMGGTDLFPQMRDGAIRPRILVDVKHLPGLGDVAYDQQAGLTVGAAVTMNEIARHPDVQARYPLLAEAASAVGSYQVRNRATIGGNLCNASPCADTALATLVLEGRVVLYGPAPSTSSGRAPSTSSGQAPSTSSGQGSERELPIAAFFLGPGETALRAGELLTAIRFPPPAEGTAGRHLKLSRNRLGDLSLVSVEVLGFPDGTASGYTFRIGLGSVAPTVVRARAAEEVLATHPPGEETFALAAERAMEAASPIDDVRSGAAYRRAMVRNLTLRGLREVWGSVKRKT